MDETAPVGVSVAVWRDGKVLLCRRGKEPSKGLWSLPGGMKRPRESLKAAVRRELLEETSVSARILDIMQVLDLAGTTLFVFRARWISGEAQAGDDAAATAWYDADNFPEAERCTPNLFKIIFADQPADGEME